MKLTLIVLFAVCTLQFVRTEDDGLPNNPDADDGTIMRCIREAMNEASANNPGTGDIFNSALVTIEDLIAQRRRCLDMPMSDPPTAWQEAARDMCMNAFRARMLFEVNNFRNSMIESGIENTTEILAEVRASYDACMATD